MSRDRTSLALSGFHVTDSFPDDRVSANFTIRELIKSEIATRRGLDNWFRLDVQLQSAVYLARVVLQPARDALGPFTPNSVFRSQAVERVIKNKPQSWQSRSQHTVGQAADFEVAGLTNLELAYWVRYHLAYDQLILECYDGKDPHSGWVHVSCKEAGNRHEVLTYAEKNGEFVYAPGLPPRQPTAPR